MIIVLDRHTICYNLRYRMKKIYTGFSFLAIATLYAVIRIPSLTAHYVAYTYDQGRDFLAGSQIILQHKIPFIGPTTGIGGLFHGSWWYYLLTLPYILFRGAPIGFYWFNFSIQFILLLLFMYFLYKKFGLLISVLFGLIVALSPYFTFLALFVGNNSMVLPSLLIFLICNYLLFEKNKSANLPLLLCITGLSLSFVGEFELSFGILLIPLYFGGVFLFTELRSKLLDWTRGGYFLLGLAIGFFPRMLFELKNGFPQTKVLLSFFLHPKLYNNPAPYLNRVSERWILFREYFFELFNEKYFAYIFLISIIVITGITVFSILKHKSKIQSVFFFYFFLLFGLFFLSTLYSDFFWKNYYEGIHYIFLFVCIALFAAPLYKKYIQVRRSVLILLVMILFFVSFNTIRHSKKPPFDGLQVQEAVADYIFTQQNQNEQYCVRIYTPSVIPHTYRYLFLVRHMNPSTEWVNGTCWFIVEADGFSKRREDWLGIHTPKSNHTVVVKKIKDVEVRHYKVLSESHE